MSKSKRKPPVIAHIGKAVKATPPRPTSDAAKLLYAEEVAPLFQARAVIDQALVRAAQRIAKLDSIPLDKGWSLSKDGQSWLRAPR